jgi:hypothetical protein
MNGILGDLDNPLTETRIPREKGWRPSRRQIRVAVAFGLIMVIGLVVLARVVATPPELRFTNIAAFPVDPKDAKAVHNIDSRLGREVELDFVPSAEFAVLLDLTNEGRRRVRITDLPDDGDLEEALFSSQLRERDERRPARVDEPVRPFSLAPGESVTVRYTFKFPGADKNPGGCFLSPDQIRNVAVTYRKLGFRRTRWMPLHEAYLSTFPSARCDENLKPKSSS